MMDDYTKVGKILNVYGLKGLLKIYSYTAPREGIFAYEKWSLASITNEQTEITQKVTIEDYKISKNLLVKLVGIDDATLATTLIGKEIYIHNQQLITLDQDEYYWKDLIGCAVYNLQAKYLGNVTRLQETGDNDALFVRDEKFYVIPFVISVYIMAVDIQNQKITVDWHIEDTV